jgi:hypothetical protein
LYETRHSLTTADCGADDVRRMGVNRVQDSG